jgi:hypothetical protein
MTAGDIEALRDRLSKVIGQGYDDWLLKTPRDELENWSPNQVARVYQVPGVLAIFEAELAAYEETDADQDCTK